MAKSLTSNAFWNALRIGSSMLFPLVTFPYTTRIWGPEGVGFNSFLISFSAYFILFSALGLNYYGTREIAKHSDDRETQKKIFKELYLLGSISSVVVTAVYEVTVFLMFGTSEYYPLYAVYGLVVFTSNFGADWYFQAKERFKFLTLRTVVLQIINVIFLFVFIKSTNDLPLAIFFGVGVSTIINLLNVFILRDELFDRIQIRLNDLKAHIRPVLKIFLLNLVVSIYVNLDIVLLGFLNGYTEVGYYNAALKLVKMLVAFISSLGLVLLPRASYFHDTGKHEEFQILIQKSIKAVLFVSIPILTFLFFLREPFILLFAGEKFVKSIDLILILAPIILFISLSNIFGVQVLISKGKENQTIISTSTGALVCIILSLLLVPTYGSIGSAFSVVIAELSVLLAQLIFLRKELSGFWNPKQSGIYLLVMIAGSIPYIVWNWFQVPINYLYLTIVSIVSAVLMLLCYYLYKEDTFMHVLNKIRK